MSTGGGQLALHAVKPVSMQAACAGWGVDCDGLRHQAEQLLSRQAQMAAGALACI